MSKINKYMMNKVASLQARKMAAQEEGQGLAEYGLILALIAVVCAAALITLQGEISGVLDSVGDALNP